MDRDPSGKTVGCVALRPLAGGRAETKRLYVTSEGRGGGLGRALAAAAIAAARRRGYREIVLDTLPGMAAAQALYRQLGFTITEPYNATPIAGTLFMRLGLHDAGC
jgi:ribosomal protein S18 acetylase RimI-like enzyme